MNRSLLIAALVALAAVGWIASGQIDSSAGQAPLQKPPAVLASTEALTRVRVRSLEAQPRAVELSLRGATEAVRSVELKAEVAGVIEAVLVPQGGFVEAGQPLLRLQQNDRAARVKQAEALLAQRKVEFTAAEKLAKEGYRATTDLAAARSALQAAEAELEAARLELGKTEIVAPFAGVVERHVMKAGDYADRGHALLRLVELDPLLVVAHASEREVLKLAPGMAGVARLSDGRRIPGTLRYVAAQGEAATRTFRLELALDNPDRTIPAGITAELALGLPAVPAYKVSPAVLALDPLGRLGVKVVEQDGRVAFQPVEILDDETDGIWLSGLPPAITLITVGQEFVAVGETVQPVPEEQLGASGS